MAFGQAEPYGSEYTINLNSKLHGDERVQMGNLTFQASGSYAANVEDDLQVLYDLLKGAGFQVSVTKRSMADALMESSQN
jgi:hypothetical protein